ncbi:hypothetical protein LTR10_021169 [Elasticomyces elasticus]|uniref:Mitochondrial thiamine pyrophosphate carrier 1 n=1 Tax=Exophiala sideris TaxID=1016849 RepID=A0ABR0JPG7_9EURO|nr:hypothetical protein LTR10_021169 [Elasticomyces elasticus]KAK5038200.1 hypothetical protein LTS07_001669 [Exophiala sideris]KAK5044184.1 hypothetical protein LTR13_000540 [Exophiala sideris]KAK5067684.1 hypothetical protein LTR69_001673 [Exophiala sideris]
MSLDDDPSEFDGILPVIPIGSPAPYKDPTSNAATGASAAGARAFAAQAVAFYFRAPVKAFFRTRVDYLVRLQLMPGEAYARSINPDVQSGRFSWRSTTPGLLAHAIRNYGWRFIPEQLLPPLAANVFVGAALYTSYLQVLGRLYEPASHATKTVYPPAPPAYTFAAGFAAGSIQSVLAAPLDALQVRFEQRGDAYQHKTMWQYGKGKLHEIGLRGIFAGWGLSFLKDSFGSGIFFSTFEYVKAQGYYNFVRWYYGALGDVDVEKLAARRGSVATETEPTAVIRPHYALEPAFLMFAGMLASVAQQVVLYPLSTLQTLHYERLEDLDKKAVQLHHSGGASKGRMLRAYYHAYQTTWKEARKQATGSGMRNWLFRGFWWFTVRQIPSTSAGLVMFELIRRKYGLSGGEVRITKDGYDILLT